MFEVRLAAPEDVPALVSLNSAYMRETFDRPWSGSAEALARDGFGRRFRSLVAVGPEGAPFAFAAFLPAYDLHHCMPGGEVCDMYVAPAWRGRGVALALVAEVARLVRDERGFFVKGQAVGDSQQRAYERLAMSFPGADCIVGGRAFRELAALAGQSVRAMVRGLPARERNYEP